MSSINGATTTEAPAPFVPIKRVCKPPGGDCHDIFDCGGVDESYGEHVTQAQELQQPHHRVTKPPGGDCSDIFATAPLATPPSTPRKKNHMSSNIFGPADAAPASAPRKAVGDSTSFNKLFGEMKVANGNEGTKATAASPGSTPRPTKDHQKSNIFFTEKTNGTTNGTNGTNGSVTPELNGHSKDKIVGDVHDSASSSGNSSGCVTPNGSSTPPNGSVNGDAEPRTNGHNGTTNGVGVGGTAAAGDVMGTPKKRIPPGGHSTKLW